MINLFILVNGEITKEMALEKYITKMAQFIKVNEKMMQLMEKGD